MFRIADKIGESYRAWKAKDIVVIDAQTGTGKTYFALNCLLPYAASQGERVLYLSNRTALREQVKLSYPDAYQGYIEVMNYQEFAALDGTNMEERTEPFKYWIMDEAHFFLADSHFNDAIVTCLEKIRYRKDRHVCIFMTATTSYLWTALHTLGVQGTPRLPEIPYLVNVEHYPSYAQHISVLELLSMKEYTEENLNRLRDAERQEPMSLDPVFNQRVYQEQDRKKHVFQRQFQAYAHSFSQAEPLVTHIESERNYSYLDTVYYRTENELVDYISNYPEKTEKWVIFVASIKCGEELYEKFSGCDSTRDTVFITAASRTKKRTRSGIALKSLIEKGTFTERILITTSVLDNGVNFSDFNIKHICILEYSQTAFLQELGRKRVQSGERVNLYLQATSIGLLRSWVQRHVIDIVKFLYRLMRYQKRELMKPNNEYCIIGAYNEFQRKYTNGMIAWKSPYCFYVKSRAGDGSWSPEESARRVAEDEFVLGDITKFNNIAVNKLTYDYYFFMSILERFDNLPKAARELENDLFWLKERLSWIGHTYNGANWLSKISGKEDRLELEFNELLDLHTDGRMSEQQQAQFRALFLEFVHTKYPGTLPKGSKASLRAINDTFRKIDYQYEVVSIKRSVNGKQRNWWTVRLCSRNAGGPFRKTPY